MKRIIGGIFVLTLVVSAAVALAFGGNVDDDTLAPIPGPDNTEAVADGIEGRGPAGDPPPVDPNLVDPDSGLQGIALGECYSTDCDGGGKPAPEDGVLEGTTTSGSTGVPVPGYSGGAVEPSLCITPDGGACVDKDPLASPARQHGL